MKRKLALFLIASLAALLLTELGVRLILGKSLETVYTLDEVVLHRLIPGSSRIYSRHPVNGGEDVLVETNSGGYRGPELGDGQDFRVAVFGDSFIHAEYSDYQHTFCARLRDRLAIEHGGAVEVVNVGVSGYGPDQSLLRIEAELAALHPNFVVISICADNDLGDLIRNKLFRLDGDQLVRQHPVLGAVVRREFSAATHPLYIWRLARKTIRNRRMRAAWQAQVEPDEAARLEVARTLIRSAYEECGRAYREYRDDRDAPIVHNLLADNYDADVALDPGSESARYKVELFRAVLARIATRIGETPALVMAIPSATDACDAHGNGAVDTEQWPQHDRPRLTGIIAAAAADCGLECIDLFEPFRARGQELYFRAPDGHWNDAGQAVAAHIVGDRILEHGR